MDDWLFPEVVPLGLSIRRIMLLSLPQDDNVLKDETFLVSDFLYQIFILWGFCVRKKNGVSGFTSLMFPITWQDHINVEASWNFVPKINHSIVSCAWISLFNWSLLRKVYVNFGLWKQCLSMDEFPCTSTAFQGGIAVACYTASASFSCFCMPMPMSNPLVLEPHTL